MTAAAAPEAIVSAPVPTLWTLSENRKDLAIAADIKTYLKGRDLLEKKKNALEPVVKRLRDHCESLWLAHIEKHGTLPPAPIKLIAPDGTSINYVISDRSAGHVIEPELLAELKKLVTRGALHLFSYQESHFEFSDVVLDELGPDGTSVQSSVENRLKVMVPTMVKSKEISADQGDRLVRYWTDRRYIANLLEQTPNVCPDPGKLAAFIGMVKAFVRSIKG